MLCLKGRYYHHEYCVSVGMWCLVCMFSTLFICVQAKTQPLYNTHSALAGKLVFSLHCAWSKCIKACMLKQNLLGLMLQSQIRKERNMTVPARRQLRSGGVSWKCCKSDVAPRSLSMATERFYLGLGRSRARRTGFIRSPDGTFPALPWIGRFQLVSFCF